MKRIQQAGSPLVILAFIAGLIGYVLGSTREQSAEASAPAQNTEQSASEKRVKHRAVYYPNMEELGPDEMRVIALGTGTPNFRRSQASASWLVELGNGEKFIFDIGTGSLANLGALEIPYTYLDKIFISHLHVDHIGDLDAMFIGIEQPFTFLTFGVETYVAHRRIKGLSSPFRANPLRNARHLWIEDEK